MEVNIVNIKHAQIATTCYSTLGKFAFPTDGTVAKLVAVKASYINIRVWSIRPRLVIISKGRPTNLLFASIK